MGIGIRQMMFDPVLLSSYMILGKLLNISETTFLLKTVYTSYSFYKVSSYSRYLIHGTFFIHSLTTD